MSTLRRTIPFVVTVGLTGSLMGAAQAARGDASVTIVHGLPNFTADIYVNDELLLDGFRPTEVAGPLTLPPGTYDVAIREVGDPADAEPVLADSLDVPANANVAVVAHVDEAGGPRLSVFSNAFEKVRAARSAFVVRSVAEAPPVTFMVDGDTVVRGLASGEEERTDLAPGTHRLEVTGLDVSLAAPMPLTEGAAMVVYVIGSVEDDSLDLMVQTIEDISSPPAGVLTGSGGLAAGTFRWPVIAALLLVIISVWVAVPGRLRRS